MEKIFYLGMMIAAGLLFGLQSPINAQLSRSVGVLEGSFLSFLGGTLVLGIAMLFFGKGHVAIGRRFARGDRGIQYDSLCAPYRRPAHPDGHDPRKPDHGLHH